MSAVSLGACASNTTVVPAPVAYVTPEPLRAMSVTPPRTDMCGATALTWLVGKPKSEIPVPVNLTNRRVQCVACERGPVVPQRLSIYFDPDTGVVEQVGCG